jgi:hypothetical protein
MLRVLFAVLILSVPASAHAQMFGLGKPTSVVSERTFGLSSFRPMRAEPVKAQPEPLPQLSGLSTNVDKKPAPVSVPVSVPMICENGVCRPAATSRPTVISRPRLFRRR